MLVRHFRSHKVPLERVSSTAEHKVMECLSGLQPSCPSQHNSTSCNTSSSSSFGGNTSTPYITQEAAGEVRHATNDSNILTGRDLESWWATLDWDASSSNSSSSSSSNLSSASSSGSFSSTTSSSSMASSLPDCSMEVASEASRDISSSGAWDHKASASAACCHAAVPSCGVFCRPWQQPQQPPQQGLFQQPLPAAGRVEQAVHRSSSWPWLPKRRSSSGDINSSRSSSKGTVIAAAQLPSSQVNTGGSSCTQPWTAASGSLWYEGGLAAAADIASMHPAAQAYLQGNLGIAFSGGGFRYTYFVGVMDVLLHKLGIIGPRSLLSGASSGSLIAVFTKCGLPVERVLQLTRDFSRDCAANGVKGRLGLVLRDYLNEYLPHDAHQLCDGSTFLASTRVWPTIRTRLFSSFPSRGDLINAVMASCHLPTLSDGSLMMRFKGQLHIDGGLLSVLTPPPRAAHTVLVCSMPSRQIAKLPAFITRPRHHDISISPDSFRDWPFTRSQTTALALQPPHPDFIEEMVQRGRADALAWAEAAGFTRNGQPVLPTAQQLEALREPAVYPPAWAAQAVKQEVQQQLHPIPRAENQWQLHAPSPALASCSSVY